MATQSRYARVASPVPIQTERQETMTLTPDTFPAGTRVESTLHEGATGTVTGWVRDNIGVRWDSGSTSCGPASHGGLRPETVEDGDNGNWREDGWYCQHSYEFCTPCFAGYDHPADEARDRGHR